MRRTPGRWPPRGHQRAGSPGGVIESADGRLATDDVAGARRALLAAAGLAAQPLPRRSEGRRANRSAQVGAFRAAVPLLQADVEMLGASGYRFGTTGAACVAVVLPRGWPAEAGYSRFGAAALANGLDCLVGTDADVPRDGRIVVLKRGADGRLVAWRSGTGHTVYPQLHTIDAAMRDIAGQVGRLRPR
ncbi:hypothetical protein GCM10009836_18800 [Pseudonocardia ailaonensis]|uniref:Uncharacterized protein n=1 Tax=Pseudonocardia ailaonensis TaxID=367279 RepID=A0ABN2MX55_9PSEU